MQPQQNQQNQQKRNDGPQWSDNTIFLCVDDEYEQKIAAEYVKARYPGTPAILVSEIPVDQLAQRHVLIPLFRPRPCSDAVRTERIQGGQEVLVRVTPKDQIGEMIEGEPLAMKEFWAAPSSNGQGGRLAFALVTGSVNVFGMFKALASRLRDGASIKPMRADVRVLRLEP